MKLVELLARELGEWPERAEVATQDRGGMVCFSCGPLPILDARYQGEWSFDASGAIDCDGRFNIYQAHDYTTAIITREMWEAERLKLEVKKMLETGLDQVIITAGKIDQIDGPLKWRDRVREIDTTVESLEEERAALVQQLEDEGFKLISLERAVPAGENMGDWRNWKAGDLLTLIEDSSCDGFTRGKEYEFIEVDEFDDIVVLDDAGDQNGYGVNSGMFKWHSRP